MGVINTYKWLKEHYENPEAICEKFADFIPLPNAQIYKYLVSRGMYYPTRGGEKEIERLKEKQVWQELAQEYKELRRWLNGPDVPIFIFPSDLYNRQMQREYNGKAGLAFRTCVFLFVSSQTSIGELKALLTHEYHHICRLHALEKEQKEHVLLDTMIMEGLAEAAVAERHSEQQHAAWVRYYTKREALFFWFRFLQEAQTVKKGTKTHEELLNGLKLYPKMLGYCTGFYIVQDCIEHTNYNTKQLLPMPSKIILSHAENFTKKQPLS
ncbi:MAG: DUF2268 domain-containing protein [Ectobacillus sp.]